MNQQRVVEGLLLRGAGVAAVGALVLVGFIMLTAPLLLGLVLFIAVSAPGLLSPSVVTPVIVVLFWLSPVLWA